MSALFPHPRVIAVIVFSVMCGAPTASAQWAVTRLNPLNAFESTATGVSAGQIVGTVNRNAALWNGASSTWINLAVFHPNSQPTGVHGGQQVGITQQPNQYWHATLWSGTAASFVDLNPPLSFQSFCWGVHSGRQVGSSLIVGDLHAGMWNGTAALWVDLNPEGALRSQAIGIFQGQQVGYAEIDGVEYAGLWNGTAGSWVALSPPGATSARAYAVHSGQQVGFARVGGRSRASLWSGTPESWVDLSSNASSSARAVFAGRQAGYSYRGGEKHACVWSGSASSEEDLSRFLVGEWTDSGAEGIWSDATTIFVVGSAQNDDSTQLEALLWTRPICPADFNFSGGPAPLSVQDIFDFLSAWFALDPRANFNGINGITPQDIFDFLAAWFAGC